MPEESTTPDLTERARATLEAMNRRDLDAVMSPHATDAVHDLSRSGMGVEGSLDAWRRMNFRDGLILSFTNFDEPLPRWDTAEPLAVVGLEG
jgi:hypothetical protein